MKKIVLKKRRPGRPKGSKNKQSKLKPLDVSSMRYLMQSANILMKEAVRTNNSEALGNLMFAVIPLVERLTQKNLK